MFLIVYVCVLWTRRGARVEARVTISLSLTYNLTHFG